MFKNFLMLFFHPDDDGGGAPKDEDKTPPVDPEEAKRIKAEEDTKKKNEAAQKDWEKRQGDRREIKERLEASEATNKELTTKLGGLETQIAELTAALKNPKKEDADHSETDKLTLKTLNASVESLRNELKERDEKSVREKQEAEKVRDNVTQLKASGVKQYIIDDYEAGVYQIPDRIFTGSFENFKSYFEARDGFAAKTEKKDGKKGTTNVPFDIDSTSSTSSVLNDNAPDPDAYEAMLQEHKRLIDKQSKRTPDETKKMLHLALDIEKAQERQMAHH